MLVRTGKPIVKGESNGPGRKAVPEAEAFGNIGKAHGSYALIMEDS